MSCISDFTTPCSGCGACYAVCPNKAIKVRLNNEGFYYAYIDDAKECTNCGLCFKVCYRSGYVGTKELTEGKMYAAQSGDKEVLLKCSSGGIAYELAKYACTKDYSPAGVVYDYNSHTAKTIISDDEEDLELFCGSKYIQSKTYEAFDKLLEMAKASPKKQFIVFGTPCQIYGFARAAEELKLRDSFLLIDIFCHGVPSYIVWNNYLEIASKGRTDKITGISFRDKKYGWHDSIIIIIIIDGKEEYRKARAWDLFYNAFLNNVLLCPACYDCKARMCLSKADIRLGDYWGKRYRRHEEGVSAVLVLTEDGHKFFSQVPSINILDETTVDEMLVKQCRDYYKEQIYHDTLMDKLITTGDLRKVLKLARKKQSVKARAINIIAKIIELLPIKLRRVIRNIYQPLLRD